MGAPSVGEAPLLTALTSGPRRRERLAYVQVRPGRRAVEEQWPQWADDAVVRGYRQAGIARPWTHQVEAAEALWNGRHVALATSTGSGKSLAFWLPTVTAIRDQGAAGLLDPGRIESVARRPTALYMCPTKALAGDQYAGLSELLATSGIADVRVSTCDGDSGVEERRWVRDYADIVLTNPDFLHYSLLPGHRRWARFLRGLRVVIVDEGHSYRGVFGAHVALVVRRLRRVAAYYGTGPGPAFAVASGTTADPGATAARLIGVPESDVVVVDRDASPAGRMTIAVWQPPVRAGAAHEDGPVLDGAQTVAADGVERPRRSATAETAGLLADLVVADARVLAFARSRRGAESIAAQAREQLAEVSGALAEQVAAYRGGYLPEERRELERLVRVGKLRGLATTNALELGVDISGLDAVLVAGWPGTAMSFWQQAGRAGRAGADGLVVFVGREDPLDTYLMQNPGALFDVPWEATVFDPANPYVLAPHLAASAAELPLRTQDLAMFGNPQDVTALLAVLVARGVLRRRSSGWYWTRPERAAALTDLRGSGGGVVRVVESATGRVLGTVDSGSADGSVHQGAVYVHQGVTHVVEQLVMQDDLALVRSEPVDYGTWSQSVTQVVFGEPAPGAALRRQQWGPVEWGYGPVQVTSRVVGFQRRRWVDMAIVGTEPLDLPERTLSTTAVWWSIPEDVLVSAGIAPAEVPGALHAAEHASIGLLPLLATCDRWDLGGMSTQRHPQTGCATVVVYDSYPGGAGFAERGYALGAIWLKATREAIAGCGCAQGCPACVQSPKCGSENAPLEKGAALRLLDHVLARATFAGGA